MNKKKLFLFALVIFSIKIFDAVVANQGVLKNICYGYMLLTIFFSLPYFFSFKGGFVLPIQLICIAIVISLFMAQYTWGQGLEHSATTIPYAMWFSFFYLLHLNPSIKIIENVVLTCGLIYIILFLFQFTHTETVYFGMREEFVEDRGIVRVNFPGGGIFYLSCFIAINRITNANRSKMIWLVYALIALLIIVLQVTRQTIVIVMAIYMIHFLRNFRLRYKIVTIVVFVLATLLFIQSGTSISKGLIEQQKEDVSAGKDYIRIQTAKFYLTEFNPNLASKIFGNGFYNDTSNYGKILIGINQKYGYYLSDVGLLEIYITFGLLAVISFFLILIKNVTIPLPKRYCYIKYYLWMVLLTSFTSDSIISYNFVIATVLVIYCYQILYQFRKDYISNNKHSVNDKTLLIRQ